MQKRLPANKTGECKPVHAAALPISEMIHTKQNDRKEKINRRLGCILMRPKKDTRLRKNKGENPIFSATLPWVVSHPHRLWQWVCR